MALLSEEEILALVAEHGGKGSITVWTSPNEEHMAVVRRLRGVEWSRFEQAVLKAGPSAEKKLKAQKQVVLDTLVYPTKDELAELLDTYPVLLRSLADAVMTMSGAADADDLKKY